MIEGPEMRRAPDDLFGFVERRSWTEAFVLGLRRGIRRGRERLGFYVVLSLLTHMGVFGLLVFSRGSSGAGAPPPQNDEPVVRQALEGLRLEARESQILAEALAGLDEDGYDYLFEYSPDLDPRLDERDRVEIFRALMRESVGRLKDRRSGLSALDFPPWGRLPGAYGGGPVRTAEGDLLYPLEVATPGRPALFRLRATTARRLESLRTEGDRERGTRDVRAGKVEVRTERGFARVHEEYYYRECPYGQMIAFGAGVFYAVSGFPRPMVADKPKTADEGGSPFRNRTSPGSGPQPADLIKIIYLPAGGARDKPAAVESMPDLAPLAEENVQKILDALMGLSDGDQVRVFMERFLNGRDPDDPLLARLTQRFLYENLGGAFSLGDRLSTAFDFLEELFYNKTAQGDLMAYGLRNPRSRVGTEILLCLAALYDFERRGLAYLADSRDEIEAVLAGRPGRADIFNKPAKAFVLAEVYRDLVAGLGRRGRDDLETVLREYRQEQEWIYRFLIAAGGEAGGRARYALGGLFWDENEEGRALKEWRSIDPAHDTPVLSQLRWIISLAYGQDLLWSRISAIFQEESEKNSTAALERYAKFRLWDKRAGKLQVREEND